MPLTDGILFCVCHCTHYGQFSEEKKRKKLSVVSCTFLPSKSRHLWVVPMLEEWVIWFCHKSKAIDLWVTAVFNATYRSGLGGADERWTFLFLAFLCVLCSPLFLNIWLSDWPRDTQDPEKNSLKPSQNSITLVKVDIKCSLSVSEFYLRLLLVLQAQKRHPFSFILSGSADLHPHSLSEPLCFSAPSKILGALWLVSSYTPDPASLTTSEQLC